MKYVFDNILPIFTLICSILLFYFILCKFPKTIFYGCITGICYVTKKYLLKNKLNHAETIITSSLFVFSLLCILTLKLCKKDKKIVKNIKPKNVKIYISKTGEKVHKNMMCEKLKYGEIDVT